MPKVNFLAVAAAVVLVGFAAGTVRAQEDPIVAKVNGTDIRLSDIRITQQQLPDPYRSYPLQMLFPDLLEMVIDRRIAAVEARDQGLQNDDSVKDTMARVEEQVLQRVLIDRHIATEVTDEALKAGYEQMIADAPASESVHARHILVESESEARQIIEELNGGADFAQLAEERSTGPSSEKGGDLGYFNEGEMVPEFSEAAFKLAVGEITQEPVQTQFGWHVIKVEDRKAAEAPTFEEAREELVSDLSRKAGAAYIETLREKAEIERFSMEGTAVE